jgi:hypothetical protein
MTGTARHDRNDLTPAQLVSVALDDVNAITDPLAKALAAGDLMQAVRDAGNHLRDIRVDCVQTLNETMGYGQIAAALGVTKARAQQLVKDVRVPKRPGVIEVQARVEAAALRNAGATDQQIAADLVPKIRAHRGGENLGLEQIAKAIGVNPVWLRPILDEYDSTE